MMPQETTFYEITKNNTNAQKITFIDKHYK